MGSARGSVLRAWLRLTLPYRAQVVAIPDEVEYHGRGPLLSARRVDLNLLWRRSNQILATCIKARPPGCLSIGALTWGCLWLCPDLLPAAAPRA